MRQFSLAVLAVAVVAVVGILAFMLGRGMPSAPAPTVYVMPTLVAEAHTETATSTATATETSANTETATPTATLTATATATLTHTITPTATASRTQIPVATRTPKADATKSADPTLVNYANHRDDSAYYLRDVKADIDVTFGKFIEGKVAASDAAWQATLQVYFDEFDAGVTWFEENTPPGVFELSHNQTYSGVLSCALGFRKLLDGAIRNDQIVYQDGVNYIGTCNRAWNDGDYGFWDVVLQHGLTWPAMSSPTLQP